MTRRRQDRLQRELEATLRALRDDGGLERLLESRLAGFERQMESLMARLLTQMVSQIFGGQGAAATATATGGLAGGIGSLLSSSILSGGLDLPGFATGGIIDGARILALGGESGPEAVLPLQRMADGRLGVRSDGDRPPVVINLTLGDAADIGTSGAGNPLSLASSPDLVTALSGALDQALDQAVAARLQDQLRAGGLLAGRAEADI